MNLINFQGLNCYYNCILNNSIFLGINYQLSFATLWSETDFTYDQINNAYSTKRMFLNLESLGAKLEFSNCSSSKDAKTSLSLFKAGARIIIGMDAFHIPWTPYYQLLHSSHYFIAQKISESSFICFDPTYNKKNLPISFENIILNAFDICHIYRVPKKPLNFEIIQEAKEIIYKHPKTQTELLIKINECTWQKRKNADLLIKYIDAMINNRYLYKHYIENLSSSNHDIQQLFNKDFFLQWKAIKNGLYKASLIKDNKGLLNNISNQLNTLINMEIIIAEKIILMQDN